MIILPLRMTKGSVVISYNNIVIASRETTRQSHCGGLIYQTLYSLR